MYKTVQHLRADALEWSENDATPNDGEIALMKTRTGSYRMKIGNGEKPFSELDSVMGFVKHMEEADSVTPLCGGDYRFDLCHYLTVNAPTEFDEDFYTVITFDSGDTPTSLTYPSGVFVFSGDSVEDNDFVPEAMTHYTLFIWYDGMMQCLVRGVAYE